MTFEDYQAMSDQDRLAYGVSQALASAVLSDGVILTDDEGCHWTVAPDAYLTPADAADGRATGFAEQSVDWTEAADPTDGHDS